MSRVRVRSPAARRWSALAASIADLFKQMLEHSGAVLHACEPPHGSLTLGLIGDSLTLPGRPFELHEEVELQEHLSSHHRDTVEKIFGRPSSANIEWRQVVSLLEAVGTVK